MDWLGQHWSTRRLKYLFFVGQVAMTGLDWTSLEGCMVPKVGIEPTLP